MVDYWTQVLRVSQYGSDEQDDDLLLFFAPAKVLAAWAGIPRKGWRIRMLYQRWISGARERELAAFWDRAANPDRTRGETHILGPTAITVAIQKPVKIEDGRVHLEYKREIDFADPPAANLAALAQRVTPSILARLYKDDRDYLEAIFNQAEGAPDPYDSGFDAGSDYVAEFGLQLVQMASDPARFIGVNEISDEEVRELLMALESLCRPALVVDGQHRLAGAAHADSEVQIPVVAMPDSDWVDQIYQFIVINEKAQRVETSLLTDIFGSSLTRAEQDEIRIRLSKANVDVEARIAAVIANEEEDSPFRGLVRLKIGGGAQPASPGYISEATIRLLIDGSTRGARGWRSDEEFYQKFVAPTISDRSRWDSWTGGAWKEYWFGFWRTIGSYYNEQAADDIQLWGPVQSNLTKAVTLRLLQALFMSKMIDEMERLEGVGEVLVEELGRATAETRMASRIRDQALPTSSEEEWSEFVITHFCNFIPVRVFARPWVASLDDDQGRTELYAELEKAFDWHKANRRYHASNTAVFATTDR